MFKNLLKFLSKSKIVYIFIIIILLLLLFRKYSGVSREFYVPAMAAFFGALSAFILNYTKDLFYKMNNEKLALYESHFVIGKMEKSIAEIHKIYNETIRGVVYIGYSVPKLNIEKLIFLVNSDDGKKIFDDLLLLSSLHEQILFCIAHRNDLLKKDEMNSDDFKSVTNKLEDEFSKYSNDFSNITKKLIQYIKNNY